MFKIGDVLIDLRDGERVQIIKIIDEYDFEAVVLTEGDGSAGGILDRREGETIRVYIHPDSTFVLDEVSNVKRILERYE